VSSISKTMMPGARLGWVVVPRSLRDKLIAAKRDSDFGTNSLTQLTFSHLLKTGAYDKHVRRQRARYKSRREALVRGLGQHLPSWTVRGTPAGLHIWVQPCEAIDEEAVVRRAEALGLMVLGMQSMCHGVTLQGFALNFAPVREHQVHEICGLLAKAAADAQSPPFAPVSRRTPRPAVPRSESDLHIGATGIDFFALEREHRHPENSVAGVRTGGSR
jgi:GntR family transcriptional regulator/MocR family aminotransferase